MKIRIGTETVATNTGDVYHAGREYEVDETFGKSLIRAKLATAAKVTLDKSEPAARMTMDAKEPRTK